MKKSLIALAVAGTFAAPAAFAATANVDVYGILDVSANNIDVKIGSSTSADAWQVGENGGTSGSRLGFKGSEDLGNGLKAIWQIESTISVDSTNSIGGRNTFVGLSGGFGTVLAGRHDTPEKISTGAMDMFADNTGDYNSTFTIIDTREQNVIAYMSPAMSGLTLMGAIVAGETSSNDSLMDHYSVAATYNNGPLSLAGGYTNISKGYVLSDVKVFGSSLTGFGPNGFTTTSDHDIFRVGASYTLGDLKLAAVYQDVDGDDVDGAGYTVGAAYTMGPIVLKGQWNSREDVLEGWTVGADYNLSKRTKAYVTYTDQEAESGSDVEISVFTVGVRHSF